MTSKKVNRIKNDRLSLVNLARELDTYISKLLSSDENDQVKNIAQKLNELLTGRCHARFVKGKDKGLMCLRPSIDDKCKTHSKNSDKQKTPKPRKNTDKQKPAKLRETKKPKVERKPKTIKIEEKTQILEVEREESKIETEEIDFKNVEVETKIEIEEQKFEDVEVGGIDNEVGTVDNEVEQEITEITEVEQEVAEIPEEPKNITPSITLKSFYKKPDIELLHAIGDVYVDHKREIAVRKIKDVGDGVNWILMGKVVWEGAVGITRLSDEERIDLDKMRVDNLYDYVIDETIVGDDEKRKELDVKAIGVLFGHYVDMEKRREEEERLVKERFEEKRRTVIKKLMADPKVDILYLNNNLVKAERTRKFYSGESLMGDYLDDDGYY